MVWGPHSESRGCLGGGAPGGPGSSRAQMQGVISAAAGLPPSQSRPPPRVQMESNRMRKRNQEGAKRSRSLGGEAASPGLGPAAQSDQGELRGPPVPRPLAAPPSRGQTAQRRSPRESAPLGGAPGFLPRPPSELRSPRARRGAAGPLLPDAGRSRARAPRSALPSPNPGGNPAGAPPAPPARQR